MTGNQWLRGAAEVTFPAGVTGIVVPRLNHDLTYLADLVFVGFTVVAMVLLIPFMGSAYGLAVLKSKRAIVGRGLFALSVQLLVIAFGMAVGRTAAIWPIAAPVTVLGLVLVLASVVRSATDG